MKYQTEILYIDKQVLAVPPWEKWVYDFTSFLLSWYSIFGTCNLYTVPCRNDTDLPLQMVFQNFQVEVCLHRMVITS